MAAAATPQKSFEAQCFSVPMRTSKVIRMWPSESKKRGYFVLKGVLIIFYVVIGVSCLFRGGLELARGHIIQFADAVAPGVTLLAQLVKYLIFTASFEAFRETIEELRKFHDSNLNRRAKIQQLESSVFLRKINQLYFIEGNVTSLFMSTSPFVLMGMDLLQHQPVELVLPLRSWWPWNSSLSPSYQITYLLQLLVIFSMPLLFTSIDNIILNICSYASMTFRSLSCDLEEIGWEVEKTEPEKIQEQLKRAAQKHVAFLEFCRKWESLVTFVVFVQFATGVSQICLSGFLIMYGTEFFMQLTYLCFALVVIQQAFIYCWGGNEIEIASFAVSNTLYEMPWYNMDIQSRKVLLVMMVQAQKKVGISTPLFDVSYPAFLNIIQKSHSYITMLNTVMTK